jgi:uncharacterized membrane protein YfhO
MNGVLAVSLPAGKQQVELVYRSKAFYDGLAITSATLVASMLLWVYAKKRSKARRH